VSPGKHPALDAWQTSASTDLTTLRDWFAPGTYNLGVVCAASGVCVIDIDPRNGGNETFVALETELGPLPPTLTADTGGGGTHFVFRRPTGDLESKLGKGIDFLRDGRQFLVEPSVHPSGGVYQWRAGHAPDEISIATLPAAWTRRVTRSAPAPRTWTPPTGTVDSRIDRAKKYLEKIPGALQGSSGSTQTFNAVAAVMFGFDLDAGTTFSLIDSYYNPRCSPLWSERDLRHKIDSCAKSCTRERGYLLDTARRPVHTTEQAAEQSPAVTSSKDWRAEMIANDKGGYKRGYANVLTFVRYHPAYQGRWSLNTMTGGVWFDGVPILETFVHEVRAHLDRTVGFSPATQDVDAAILSSAQERTFHPIQQYLRSVDWDGQPRLVEMAATYFGSESALHSELVRKWMISAVARALNPGCKVDTALMLYGKQGFYKSSFFAILGGTWHADSPIDIANKDSFQQIHAAWLYEFAELENVVHGRAESRLKAWLTSTHDMFRAPYARVVSRRARSCVICGTTNRQQFLTDDTGSRRFWIVEAVKPIPKELLAANRDQLWAEAVTAYDNGETWWLEYEADAQLEVENVEFEEEDAWHQIILDWMPNHLASQITTSFVMTSALKLDAARQDRGAQTRVGRILRQIGWKSVREGHGERRRYYVRGKS